MKLSVVILNYNVRYFLQLCLQSVAKALEEIDAEIIVVDNASADDSMKMVAAEFPQVKCIQNTENLGFSKGNNVGIASAEGEYICILNPDTVVAQDTFKEVLAFAEKMPDFGAVGVQLIDGRGHFLPESKRNIPTPRVAFAKLLGKSNAYYANDLKPDENGPVQVLVGAFMLFKKEVYKEVGGLDETYFMYGEDIDLSYSLLNAGYQNYYFGTNKIVHFKGESSPKDAVYLDRFYGAMRIFYQKYFARNPITNSLVQLSLAVAKKAAAFQTKEKPGHNVDSEKMILISNDMLLAEAFREESLITLLVSVEELQSIQLDNQTLLFDAGTVSFSEIIETISNLKNSGLTFKIRPANCNFILGSNHSDQLGEIRLVKY
ncbi:glycosyltransferase family 2 protein [Gangjinia marincola]|uniref:Glycosyltransferase family 2 protein n=1 Tax=Gangjinia marincola TaxID=578463 RepID=A0ABN1MFV0_9FLAO